MACDYLRNCFEVMANGGVSLAPQLSPHPENGLECRPNGLWDPDERVAEFCELVQPAFFTPTFTNATNVTAPILNTFNVTNPSAIHPAIVMWHWYLAEVSIQATPGTRGTVVTLGARDLNPLIDVAYCVFQNAWASQRVRAMPGPSFHYVDCPGPLTAIPPGGAAQLRWAFRFEGAGAAGTWSAFVGDLRASALVVVTP